MMILVLGSVLVAAVPVTAQDAGGTPTPAAAVKRACDAAGGLDAFMTIGVVELHVNREEVTQDGHKTNTSKTMFFLAPGPIPGRTEDPQLQVIAGDDGNGGWATVGGQVDSRPSTTYMVKRLLTGELFPLLLPFSLTWEGVTVTDVVPVELAGQPVWRLKVELNHSFFHSPQISTSWTVDLDRRSFALAQAQSPATDLGKGLRADGMKFSWGEPVKLKSVALPGYQRIVGLDEAGREKSHSRIDHIVYKLLKPEASSALFSSPIPPEQRPQLPVMQPPPLPQGKPGG
jgi:hypothetical protein